MREERACGALKELEHSTFLAVDDRHYFFFLA